MRRLCQLVSCLALALGAAATTATSGGAASDAPDPAYAIHRTSGDAPPSYVHALQVWRNAADVNAWIGQHFRYDLPRALQLSESQRARTGTLPIHEPAAFYAKPDGVCVDLSRFAVETLRALAPETRPRHLMIEFDPVTLQGQTLRRHWLALYEQDGQLYAFGDSRRPGHIAGPYADTAAFVADYARYRGRSIVAYRELPTHERTQRARTAARTPTTAPVPAP